jgi:hypothetical protein
MLWTGFYTIYGFHSSKRLKALRNYNLIAKSNDRSTLGYLCNLMTTESGRRRSEKAVKEQPTAPRSRTAKQSQILRYLTILCYTTIHDIIINLLYLSVGIMDTDYLGFERTRSCCLQYQYSCSSACAQPSAACLSRALGQVLAKTWVHLWALALIWKSPPTLGTTIVDSTQARSFAITNRGSSSWAGDRERTPAAVCFGLVFATYMHISSFFN